MAADIHHFTRDDYVSILPTSGMYTEYTAHKEDISMTRIFIILLLGAACMNLYLFFIL